MAKRLLSLIFFLLTTFLLLSQGGFEYSSLFSFNQEVIAVEENAEGNYLLALGTDTINSQKIIFYELDQEGQIINSKVIYEPDCILHIAGIFSVQDYYLAFGYKDCDAENANQVWVLKLSLALEIIDEQIYELSEQQGDLTNPRARLLDDSTIAFSAIFRTGPYYRPMGGIVEFNEASFTYSIWKNNSDVINDFTFRNDSTGFVLYGARLYYTDSLFNVKQVVEESPTDFGISPQGTIEEFNDTLFLLTGKYGSIDTDGIIVGVYNYNFEVIQYDTIATLPDDNPVKNYPAPKISLSKDLSGDHFYLGGILNIDIFNYPYSNNLSSFVLAKYDMSINKYWQKTYGGDAYYFMRGLLATSDGGCLMYGFRYQVGSQTEAYVLKVDGDGIITGTMSIPLPVDRFLLYPNPFQNTVVVETSRSIDKPIFFKLFDVTGRMVFESNISNTQQLLDFSFLNMSGIFTYKIEGQNLLQSGVLIKIE